MSLRAGHAWWWVPVVAPLVGGVVGALIYRVFVEMHHPSVHKRARAYESEPEGEPLDKLEKPGPPEVCV